MSKTPTSKKTANAKGVRVKVRINGKLTTSSAAPLAPMSSAEVERRAREDRDNPPLSRSRMAKLRPVARTKALRRALGLTQEEFAKRYCIPIGTLRDWEQGRSEPDQPARAYLTVIARDPDAVRQALVIRAD